MYALIKNGTVHGHIDTDALNAAEITAAGEYLAVECAGIPENGSTYDADTGVITPPVAPTPEPPKRHITVGRFFDRFGSHKYPVLASSNPMVQALIKDCSVRSYIDLDDPQLPYGLQMLVDAGYAVDVQEILTAPITPVEQA